MWQMWLRYAYDTDTDTDIWCAETGLGHQAGLAWPHYNVREGSCIPADFRAGFNSLKAFVTCGQCMRVFVVQGVASTCGMVASTGDILKPERSMLSSKILWVQIQVCTQMCRIVDERTCRLDRPEKTIARTADV